MRILLIGEYSGLHNSLKEGLIKLNHDVKIIANSDGFKNFPVDYSIDYKLCKLKVVNLIRQVIVRIFKFDIAKVEQGLRFYFYLGKLKNYDVVQFINETPIKATKKLEFFLLKKIFDTNKKVFVLSCGVDSLNLNYYIKNKSEKSILQPYFASPKIAYEYNFVSEFFKKKHQKIHHLVVEKCKGIIATDFDYVPALKNHPKYLGFIPYPINHTKFNLEETTVKNEIVIFLGINQWSYHQKGIIYFEKALEIIQKKYNTRVKIIIAKTIPYAIYINLYNQSHILLDQCLSCDQGYNALEAMAKGKVVFTGSEANFIKHFNITEKVCINAKADVNYLVNELSYLIENPTEIIQIGKRARNFVLKEHDYVKIAQEYLNLWR